VAAVSAQYDYTPPQRQFNAGGQPKKDTYGLPGHTPGQPQGETELQREAPSVYSSPAVAGPPQPVRDQISIPAPIQDSYGPPAQQQQQQFRQPAPVAPIVSAAPIRQSSGGFNSAPAQEESYTPQVFRHVCKNANPL